MHTERTWHLIFYRDQFTMEMISDFLDRFQKIPNFGGFPVRSIKIDHYTNQLIDVIFKFEQVNVIDAQTLQEMAKYILLMVVEPNQITPPIYYEFLKQSENQLGIEVHSYPNHTMDLIYWHAPKLNH